MRASTFRFLCGVSIVSALAVAGAAYANHSWGGYHWGRTANPFTLKVGNNVTGQWQAAYAASITDWSQSTMLDLQAVAGGARTKKCAPSLGRVEVCNSTYGRNGWLGIAQVWISGNHITQGAVKLNDTYFNTASYNKPEWRNFVTCQEIGHTLGLDHQDEGFNNGNLGTCMDYTSFPLGPPNNEHPNSHDYDQLVSIYGHVDAAGTILSPNLAPEAAGDAPNEWGMLMRSTNRGRTQVYERELGGGHKVATFVIWAGDRERGHGDK